LHSGKYTLEAVDAVIDVMFNATGITVFIIGQRFDFRNRLNAVPVAGEMEIRRISSNRVTASSPIILLKTGEHYESLV